MLKKMAVLFVILGSTVFAQWEKEYVKDKLENQQEIIILFIKDMIILQYALYKKQYYSSA